MHVWLCPLPCDSLQLPAWRRQLSVGRGWKLSIPLEGGDGYIEQFRDGDNAFGVFTTEPAAVSWESLSTVLVIISLVRIGDLGYQ